MRKSEYMQRNPVRLDISRSKFRMSPRWTGTFNSYKLVPIFTYTDVLPGDTFKMNTSFVIRMSTPIAPVMDDLFLDVAFYFVPHELILSRSYMSPSTSDSNHSWKAFIGAQDSLLNMPVPDGDIELPHFIVGSTGVQYIAGGLCDCFGLPDPEGSSYYVNVLPFLAFMAVWNENYRDPNLQNPGVFGILSAGLVNINWSAVGSSSGPSGYVQYLSLPNVCRFHGYFGSALPWPQRNSETVSMPLGTTAPIIAGDSVTPLGGSLRFGTPSSAGDVESNALSLYRLGGFNDGVVFESNVDADGSFTGSAIDRSNLVADLANASAVSINTFRLAVQEQRWYEALARGGNRIDELTAALFGVMPKDAGGNQPEYLGGKRIPINVSQVNVTANSNAGSQNNAVGDTGAFSVTSDVDYYFTKSFDRWGSIIGVCCVRYRDSFGKSLNRMFTRHERFDYYFPQFANLGEQPVYRHEADVSKKSNSDAWPVSDVFGYQEAWADYRYIPDVVTGLVRPGKSLGHWTYANGAVGTLAQFITGAGGDGLNSAADNVDRTLVVQSSGSGLQFLAQFQFDIVAVRPMPLYSIPGLVDHH